MTETFIADPTIDQIPFKGLKDLFQLWQDIEDEHGLPKRKHLTPMQLAGHLAYLVLMDYEKETGRFKVRLIGTRYTEAIGFESTGSYVDKLPNAETMIERYQWLVENKKPYYAYMDKMQRAGLEYRYHGIVACPLYSDEGDVEAILFRVTFERADNVKPVEFF